MGANADSKPITPNGLICLIYDGTERDKMIMERIRAHLERRTQKSIIILSARDEEGQKAIRLYHLHGKRFVLVLRKNGDLHHVWTDEENLDAPHIAYIAEQAK